MASCQSASFQLMVFVVFMRTTILEKAPSRRSLATPLSISSSSLEIAR